MTSPRRRRHHHHHHLQAESSSSSSGSSTSSSSYTPRSPPPPGLARVREGRRRALPVVVAPRHGRTQMDQAVPDRHAAHPAQDMMRDHGTPEMGSWVYQAREARETRRPAQEAASAERRHVRGAGQVAPRTVDDKGPIHDGDGDRFYNALLAARLHHAAWALHCNEKRSSAALACNLFERWREGTSVEAPQIHIMLKYEIACCAAGRPAVEERGTQHAVSLAQRDRLRPVRNSSRRKRLSWKIIKPKLIDDPASNAAARCARKRKLKSKKTHGSREVSGTPFPTMVRVTTAGGRRVGGRASSGLPRANLRGPKSEGGSKLCPGRIRRG